MGEVEIFTLSAPFNLTNWAEIFISLSFNIVPLQPVSYCLRSKLPRYWRKMTEQSLSTLSCLIIV
jgi:hypothetical protein